VHADTDSIHNNSDACYSTTVPVGMRIDCSTDSRPAWVTYKGRGGGPV